MTTQLPDGNTPHIAIIGGGITGLSTAWYLQNKARLGANLRYTILEKSARWGGKIETDRTDGFVFERAADAFLAVQKPWAVDLAYALGLDAQILPTNDARRRVYVLHNGALVTLPRGMNLIVPTDLEAFMASPLLTQAGKARLLQEREMPQRVDPGDESLADFVLRRLGQEALDVLGEPLMSGIYNADPHEQSLLATFPRFREMERQHGSLLGAVDAAKKARMQNPLQTTLKKPASAFISFRDGTAVLTETLAEKLTGDMRLNCGVVRIYQDAERCPTVNQRSWSIEMAEGHTLRADAVILTTPASVTARLLNSAAPTAAAQLRALRAVSSGTITFAFRRDEVDHPLDGFGVVIPRSEQRPINAMTWASTKFDHRAPDDQVLIRLFFGGVRSPQMMAKSDDEISVIARHELAELLGIKAKPTLQRVYRWHQAQPQYDVGHLDRVAQIEADLPKGLYVAGCFYRGVGIPDCVRQGRDVAERVVESVISDSSTEH